MQIQMLATLLFRYKRFINFWFRRGTQFFLCWPHHQSSADLMVFKISVCRDPKKPNYIFNFRLYDRNSILSATEAENSTACFHGPMSTPNWLFFKILKFSWPSLLGMTSSTLQPHILSGVYYDNSDCHILFTWA